MALIVIDVETWPSGKPVEEDRHVGKARDRHADPADLSLGLGGVRVVAHLGRQVERDREARLAVVEQVTEPAVGLLGRREARVLAHRPEAAAVHRGLDAAGERVLAGSAEVAVLVEASRVGRGVEVSDDEARRSLESRLALGRSLERLGSERLAPPFAGRIEASPVGRSVRPGDPGVRSAGAQSRTRRRSPTSIVWPDADRDARDDAVARGAQLVLHLHRLHDEELLTRDDGVARNDRYARDHARDDGTDLGRSAVRPSSRGPRRARSRSDARRSDSISTSIRQPSTMTSRRVVPGVGVAGRVVRWQDDDRRSGRPCCVGGLVADHAVDRPEMVEADCDRVRRRR